MAAPTSSVETIAGLDEFGDVTDPVLVSATQPAIAIKVLDRHHNAVYVWSLDRLQQQLQRMRNLTTYIDRPSYTQHFSSDEPFYDIPPPEYSFIGNALVALAPLSRGLSSTSTVPIFCRYTSEAIGSCRIDIKLVSVVASNKPVAASHRAIAGSITPGSRINFFLTVDAVRGLSAHDFSTVHLQVRLSALTGITSASEEVFPSPTVDIDASLLSSLKFRRSFSLVASSKVLHHLREGYSPIEFFAALRPAYLDRMEHWDQLREQKLQSSRLTPNSQSPSLPIMRRSENDFVVEQNHDVVAWLKICELGADGQYAPVSVVSQSPLDPGSFSLHQGLQRKVIITMSSNSGMQLPWTEIVKTRLGNVRLLDPKGRIHDSTSKAVVTLALQKDQELIFNVDGTAALTATSLWDSSVHDSVLLNRVTAANQRILLQLKWSVAVDTCSEPMEFSMDVAVTMQSRDARAPSKFMGVFTSSKIISKTSTVFKVRLSPPLTRSARDLWRLDTAAKYVRGEEALGVWKPRGLSVVEDYTRLVATERRAADVQAVRVILDSVPAQTALHAQEPSWGPDVVLQRALSLWMKKFTHIGDVN